MTDSSTEAPGLRLSGLPLRAVSISDRFWAPRLEANRSESLPFQYQQLQAIGAIEALDVTRDPGLRVPEIGNGVTPQMWWDSDVAKWIEAASYSLATKPDAGLEAQVDDLIARLAAAQGPDGYLNSYFTGHAPEKRLTNERDWHELYCAGHLIEAAVAHSEATGKTSLLAPVERYVTFLMGVYGPAPGQKHGYPGHPEIELALVRLYRLTGKREYLDFASYFLDERGRQPHYFDLEARARGADPANFRHGTYEYMQAHRPVREQEQVKGHAVRAMYLYSAMADLAAEEGDPSLRRVLDRLWDDLTGHRLYVTGGLGPSASNEGMTSEYDLPNESAYAETCAAVGLVFWASRMLDMTGDGRYADVLERALYNNVLSGVSLDGRCYFYDNPLASLGNKHRWTWHSCPCCPPNAARLLASLGHYAYGRSEKEFAVHLYVAGAARAQVAGGEVSLHIETDYPWDGRVLITIATELPRSFTLSLRIPGWCREARAKLNGRPLAVAEATSGGYLRLEREWRAGDSIELELSMPVERVYAHPRVQADSGLVALQRGPVVYCLEEADNPESLHQIALPRNAALDATFQPSLLGGVTVIEGEALADLVADWSGRLYRTNPPHQAPTRLRAIPYATWDHRQPGEMRVWIREACS